jgi:1-acyl-sn-glycerol-3-phosphate acyltransferase
MPVEIRFLAKRSLFSAPFIGYHLRRAGHLPVEREDVRASLKTMGEAAQMVRDRGISVLIFPEGGRSPQEMREFREGAAYIAIKAGAPVVPIGLDGTRQILPMGSLHMKPGEVVVRIGEPIPAAGLKIHNRHELTEQLQQRVTELVGTAYRS